MSSPKPSRTLSVCASPRRSRVRTQPGGEGNQCYFLVCASPRRPRVRTQPGREGSQCYFLFSSKRKSPWDIFRREAKPGHMINLFQLWQAVCISQASRWKWPTVDRWRGNTVCVMLPAALPAIRRKLMGLLSHTTGGRGPPGRYFNILRSHSSSPNLALRMSSVFEDKL